MPAFTFSSPDGKSYTINGPEGATQEQAFGILQQQLGQQQPSQPSPGIGAQAADAATQLGVGVAQGVESIPATAPSLVGLAGRGVQAGLDKFAPGFTDPTRLGNEAKMRQLAAQARGGGIADYLPKAQTGTGEATNTVGQFLPSALGMSGSLVRNAVGGVTAGLGAFGAGKAAPNEDARPYFEAGGALLGGAAGLRSADAIAQRAAARTIPTTADVLQNADNRYKAITSRSVLQGIPQSSLDTLADSASRKLMMEGPRPSVAQNIHTAIDEIRTPAMSSPDVADLVSGRQNVKAFFQNAAPDPNKAGASKVLPLLDAEIERQSPGTSQALRDADRSWSIGRSSEALDKKLARAELRNNGAHSALNLGNQIRQRAADMLLTNDAKYLSPEATQALTDVNKGTVTQNAMRMASNWMGGGGGLGSTLLGVTLAGGGAAGGYYTGHPELAAVPALGIGLRMASNRSIANQAKLAGALIRSQSPMAKEMGVEMPKALSRSDTARLAAILSARPVGTASQLSMTGQ